MNQAARADNREFEFTQQDFEFLRKLANQQTGIVLKEDKFNMLYSRLSRRIRILGLNSFREYCQYLEKDTGNETDELINSITTNLTAFFREKHHFDYLSNTLVPHLLKRNAVEKKIRVWSAGCSTGEEPYTIAMTLMQSGIPSGWDVRILATDIDQNVLAHASTGVYQEDRIQGLSSTLSKRWFTPGSGANQGKVRVARQLRDLISFNQLNLLKDWPFHGPFDAIFCRNVVIYFDGPTKKTLVERYAQYMHDDSCLFLGHSESLFRVTTRYKSIGQTIYQKDPDAS